MNAPFYKFEMFGDEFSLIVAFIIGIGFGFFLERAGFGSGRKLAAQFYFTDMSVLKVMFSAIVTAMLGVFYLSWIGFMDLSLVYLTPTYLAPQIVGGLLLGIGFVVGGYCPGTSAVACSTGRIDAMVYFLGIFGGIFMFGFVFPFVKEFYYSTPMGKITLPQWFNIPYGVLVFAVVVMAVGAFAAAEWGEKKMARKQAEL
ncbi:sulfurtransferase [bacterium]|nr:MAG: sulfurtransferase [bacterium]